MIRPYGSHTSTYRAVETVQAIRTEIVNLEEQREIPGSVWIETMVSFTKFLKFGDPADLKASLNDVELRLKHQEFKLEELGRRLTRPGRSSTFS